LYFHLNIEYYDLPVMLETLAGSMAVVYILKEYQPHYLF